MDIDLLSKMVAELILDNDEVGLPGVGTFVAEEVPSTFSDKGYTINPPYRRLSFRQKEISDTKLIEFYAGNNDLDIATSSSILKDFLAEMKSILMSKKVIVFPGLGRLRATRENNFFFIPDEDLNIYPDGYGLEPVSLKTHEETEDEVQSAVAGLQSILAEAVPAVSPDAAVTAPSPEEAVSEVAEDEAVPATPAEPAAAQPAPEENTGESVAPAEPEPVEEPAAPAEPEPVEEPVAPAEPVVAAKSAEPECVPEEVEWDREYPEPSHLGWKIAAAIVAAVLLFFGLFLLLAYIAPDFIDHLLYSKEELEIIRHF